MLKSQSGLSKLVALYMFFGEKLWKVDGEGDD